MSQESVVTAQYFNSMSRKDWQQSRANFDCSITLFENTLYLAVTSNSTQVSNNCGKLLRYDYPSDTWNEVYQLPLFNEGDGISYARESKLGFGQNNSSHTNKIYSEMAVFKGESDNAAALYLSIFSSGGSQLLRTENGEDFYAVPKAEVEQYSLSFRRFLALQNKLYASCSGKLQTEIQKWEDLPIVYGSNNPALGVWQDISLLGFGDFNNKAIPQIVEFNNCLYVGTLNSEQGFQVWKTQILDQNSAWEKVISKGAYRYTMNEFTSSMVVFKGNLYIASGTFVVASNNINDINIVSPELICIYPDDSWDLIVGTPKFTPDGLKVPLSGMGPGFDDFSYSAFQCLLVHNDYLYVGVQKPNRFQMWASEDGESWEMIPLNGITNYPHVELCAAMSTPFGLTLVFDTGTSQNVNDYLSNSLGANGLEIWIGKESYVNLIC